MLPVDLSPPGIDVDVSDLVPSLALPKPSDDVESDDDEDGEIGCEESFCIERFDGDVEL